MILFKFLTVVILALTLAACILSGQTDAAEAEEEAA